MELFQEENELGITEISNKLNIPKSTVFNIMFTFKKLNYVRKINNNKYKLSSKIFELSQSIEFDLRIEAKPYLRKLANKTNETINLVIHIEDKVLYTEKVESTEPININTQIGKKEDVYCTAVGKAILAYLEENRRKQILDNIELSLNTPNTILDEETLKEELLIIKEKGYAVDNEEFAIGVKCVAAPIFNHKGEPVSAISITGPTVRINSKGEKKLANLVMESTYKISNKLGYTGNFS